MSSSNGAPPVDNQGLSVNVVIDNRSLHSKPSFPGSTLYSPSEDGLATPHEGNLKPQASFTSEYGLAIPHEVKPQASFTSQRPLIDSGEPVTNSHEVPSEQPSPPEKRDWRFWAIFAGLCVAALVSSLEGTIVSTALPTISAELSLGSNYVWVINVYFLTSAVFQPLFGQFADLFGRRWLMLGSILLFVIASAICGAAKNAATLIVGRAIQGIGGGGINMLVDVVVCDLVPLNERGNIIGLLFAVIALGSSFGPLIGGALTSAGQWRWVFFLNLPVGATSLVILFIYLRVSHKGDLAWSKRLSQIDYVGNVILVASTVLILYVLTYAGSKYEWNSPIIIALLVVGLVLLVVFFLYERSPYCQHPVAPAILFSNRTSGASFFISFNHAILLVWATYIYPLYFQAVLGASPARSGINLLVLAFIFPFFAAIGGAVLGKTGEYKFIHVAAMSLLAVGIGSSSVLDQHSTTGVWVGLQIVIAAGLGGSVPALLPAVQAELSEAEAASSTGTWAFVRSLGTIWGISVPAAIFNNRAEQLAGTIVDPIARAAVQDGQAYGHGTAAFIGMFTGDTKDQLLSVYANSLKLVWQVGVVFAGLSVLAALCERRVKLRQELETEFGLEKKQEDPVIELGQGQRDTEV